MKTTDLLTQFLIYTLESSIILIVFYIFYHVLLRKDATFNFNRYYLLITPIVAAVLPLLSFPLGYFNQHPQIQTDFILQLPEAQIHAYIAQRLSFQDVLVWIVLAAYVMGLIISLYGFMRQLSHLRQLRNDHGVESWMNYKVVLTNGQYPTFSFMKVIYYDNKTPLPKEEKSMILLHESIHIQEKHSIDIIFTKIVCAIFWYNPLFSLFLHAIRLNHEYIVDAKVIATVGISKPAYRKSLALNALHTSYLSLGTFYSKSQILTRMKMMNQSPKSIKSIKMLTLSFMTICLIFVFSCENNEEKISNIENVSITDDKDVGSPETTVKTSDEVFTVVEEQPTFQGGGNAAFIDYVGKNLQFPEALIEKNIEGKVYVEFVIEKDGTVTNVAVVKGLDPDADKEAERVIQNSPQWTPGKQNGNPVRVRMILPIQFSL